ncbi:MAG TPA: hypothetical protein VD929_04290 [Caulobacteraceae bacterium]|nr:hypothetical protein [Caulobacteraceae bacterium]
MLLVDLLGLAGLGAALWTRVGPLPGEIAAWSGTIFDAGLMLAACALVVRGVDAVLRRREARGRARDELLRRLAELDAALLDLRATLSPEAARRFVERREAFAAGAELARTRLTRDERAQANACQQFCDQMTEAVAAAVAGRAGAVALAERLAREIDRAARRDDLDRRDADALTDLLDDAARVADEPVFAEWNSDHFGRLAANRRHFGRELGRCEAHAADRLEQQGLELFDRLLAHVRAKVEIADLLQDWREACGDLEAALSGVTSTARRDRSRAPQRLADRFPEAGARGVRVEFSAPKRRLTAAND